MGVETETLKYQSHFEKSETNTNCKYYFSFETLLKLKSQG